MHEGEVNNNDYYSSNIRCNKIEFDENISYLENINGNTKNRNSELQNIYNALNYLIIIQGAITNANSSINSMSSYGKVSLINLTILKVRLTHNT